MTDPACQVVLWAGQDLGAGASFAAELARRGIEVRRAVSDRDESAMSADLMFVEVDGRLLVDPSPTDVSVLLFERRIPPSASDMPCVQDGRSATVGLVDLGGFEHEVVVVDRPTGSVCACLLGGRLMSAAAPARAGALHALALQVSLHLRATRPDGVDRLRLMMLASSGPAGSAAAG